MIAPHPDDESIGCGGSLCLHVARNDRVSAVFLTSGELGLKNLARAEASRIREEEARDAAAVLGLASTIFLRGPDGHCGDDRENLAQALSRTLATATLDLVYLPHVEDGHADHQAASGIFDLAVVKAGIAAPAVRRYEVWTPMAYYDDGEDITEVIKRKLRAVRCHRSQVAQLRYDRAVHGLSEYRGAAAWGCRYAEVFQRVNSLGPPNGS